MLVKYGLSFLEGILTFISPCMLPMLPLYLFYLAGTSESERQERTISMERRARLVRNAAAFIAGFTVVFVLMGAVATAIGSFLNGHLQTLRYIGGVLMIVFGLGFAGVLKLRFLQNEKRLPFKAGRLTLVRSLLFGGVFAFGWTPCVGYLLSSSLIMAGSSGSVAQGMLLLLLYSLGLGLPFIVSSLIYHEIRELFHAARRYSRLISVLSGVILITAGLLTLLNRLDVPATWR